MTVTFTIAGGLKAYLGGRDHIEVPAGGTVAELLEASGVQPALVAAVMLGETLVPLTYRPREGDVLKLIGILGGG
ncbi:MAG TPA: hypothetical protein ENL34_13435 [Chloroflexi bacterium]|nr:hypothetical protein [Chloroflexota bacterium]